MPTYMKVTLVIVFVLWLAAHWPDDNWPNDGAAA